MQKFLLAIPFILVAAASAQPLQVVSKSEVCVAGEVEAVETLDDTCTSFCDRCADKADAICDQGVSTYNCGCRAESQSCNFTCQTGKV